MALFSFNGLDEISASFEQLAKITDEDKIAILSPSADLLLQRQKEKIVQLFRRRTGDLEKSLTISQITTDDGPGLLIYPKGKHRSSFTGKRMGKRSAAENRGAFLMHTAPVSDAGNKKRRDANAKWQ